MSKEPEVIGKISGSPSKTPKADEADDLFQEQEKQRYPVLYAILESTVFNVFITLLTIYALFGDDVRVLAFNKNADLTFDIINIVALVAFSVEIILAIFVKADYFNSFFFYLDLISTISLVLDIQMFSQAIGLTGGGSGGKATDTASLARAGRASRVGTKAGRVVRLVRLIRIVKLYKQAADQKKQESEDEEYENLQESKVSKKLSDLTTKRVIIIVLALLLLMPLMNADYYADPPQSLDYFVDVLKTNAEHSRDFQELAFTYNQTLQIHKDIDTPLAKLQFGSQHCCPSLPYYETDQFQSLRVDEMQLTSLAFDLPAFKKQYPDHHDILRVLDNEDDLAYIGVLDLSWTAQKTAIFSIGKTIFVCIVLTIGALMFSKDANDLALRPIERMIEKVKKIAKNPKKATEEKLVNDPDSEKYEAIIIENAIIKIGTLLALGFGDAGSEIIASNMSKSGDVNPMLPGKKKCCIFGFCDIRNFTDATEVLQEDVMLFVNNIGDVVHQICDRFMGSANKNIGDAFLLVWKLNDGTYEIQKDNSVEYLDKRYVQMISDCSILTFMKVWCKMNREPKILKYREDERLSNRLKNYRVKLGLGLHIGWSIEGAIGSEFKIDASYLSPSVNMSMRLEGATKVFGVPLLMTGDVNHPYDVIENSCNNCSLLACRSTRDKWIT